MNMMIAVLMIAGLLFGGGATVNAARDDLPNEPLYAVKLWSEELSLQIQNDPDRKIDRLMDLAEIRIQEMTRLTDAGIAVPDQERQRLEQHIHQALQLCSTMDDAALDKTLLQIRDRLQQHDRAMDQLQLHAAEDSQLILAQTRSMLRQQLRLVEEGLLDHEMFRNAVHNGFRYGQEEDVIPPGQNRNGERNGQPSPVPTEPNTAPGGPNPTAEPGGPNTDPGGTGTGPDRAGTGSGGPNTSNGGGNTDPGGPNGDPGGPHPDSGSDGTGGNSQGGNGPGGNAP